MWMPTALSTIIKQDSSDKELSFLSSPVPLCSILWLVKRDFKCREAYGFGCNCLKVFGPVLLRAASGVSLSRGVENAGQKDRVREGNS